MMAALVKSRPARRHELGSARVGKSIARRLESLLPPMLRPVPADPEDECAFDAYAIALTRQLGLLTSVVMMVFTAGWWLLDPLVMPDERNLEVFAWLRIRALVVEVLALGIFLWVPMRGVSAFFWATLTYALLLATFGYSLGELGGPDLSWLANAYLGIVPIALMPVRLPGRVIATSVLALALLGAFLLPFPENRELPRVAGQVSFAVFAVLLTVVLGELSLRVMRRAFFERQSAARANERLASLTDSLATTVAERTRDLRALALHLDQVQESERRRIARDLHDDLGQTLTAMRYTLARLEDRTRKTQVEPLVEDLTALLDGTTTTVRGFLSTLRPRILEDLGLVAASEWLRDKVRAAGLACELEVSPEFASDKLSPEIELVLFRLLQEATTNTLKHAEAKTVKMELALDGERALARVSDDGRGFDAGQASTGFGLLGLSERLKAGGGELQIESRSGSGTSVTARLPRQVEAVAA